MLSIRGSYITRTEMLNAAKWCFYRDAHVIPTLRSVAVGKSLEQLRAEEIINAAFDARDYNQIPFIAVEDEFRVRGEHEIINALIDHLETDAD